MNRNFNVKGLFDLKDKACDVIHFLCRSQNERRKGHSHFFLRIITTDADPIANDMACVYSQT